VCVERQDELLFGREAGQYIHICIDINIYIGIYNYVSIYLSIYIYDNTGSQTEVRTCA